MSAAESFYCRDLLSDAEVEAIFAEEAEEIEAEILPPDREYVAERRKYIGPVADITHPEFGRPNQIHENFRLSYCVTVLPVIEDAIDENGQKVQQQLFMHKVDETVVDHQGHVVGPILRG